MSYVGIAPVYIPFAPSLPVPSLPVDPAYPYPSSMEINIPLTVIMGR